MKLNSIIRFAGVLACAGFLHVSAASAATETVVYSFRGGSDGDNPVASLINVNGTLYGTTKQGGGNGCGGFGCGTVFSITQDGTEKVLYSFRGGSDGSFPSAGLLNVNGTLYGTTTYGGGTCEIYGCGTVYSITQRGTEKVLYSFGYKAGDGHYPSAGLIKVDRTLYGTTYNGGRTGLGSVFSVIPGGPEAVLHSFAKRGDGAYPLGGLLNVNSTLYGTTVDGGPGNAGAVFSITPSGTETVHFFRGSTNARGPFAGLINVDGTLYGTTWSGGVPGFGTVFSITTSGTEKVLYSFKGGSDGSQPYAGLIHIGHTLYGTTTYWGCRRLHDRELRHGVLDRTDSTALL
jgi:uncharacterized repeat protein (TIGR03803 family)